MLFDLVYNTMNSLLKLGYINRIKGGIVMKFKKAFGTFIIVVFGLVLGTTGCSKDRDINGDDVIGKDSKKGNTGSYEKVDDVSYDIFSEIIDLEGTEKNTVASPISIQRALEVISKMTSDRADLEVFNIYDKNSLLEHEYNNSVMETILLLNKKDFNSKAVNKIIDNIKLVDFPKKAEKEVLDLQNRVLEEVIYKPEFNEDATLIIADAIRYYSKWRNSFDEANTTKMPFKTSAGETVSVDTMYQKISGNALVTDQYEVFSLNADEDAIAYFIKPKSDINHVKDNLGKIVKEYNDSYEEFDVNFYLPKTSIENELDIKKLISNIGLDKLIKSGVKPDKLTEDMVPLFISKATQVAKMDVDEEGAEAKAVTVITMEKTALPQEKEEIDIKMDSPYFIVITDREKQEGRDYVVFTSLIVNPLEN